MTGLHLSGSIAQRKRQKERLMGLIPWLMKVIPETGPRLSGGAPDEAALAQRIQLYSNLA